MGILSFGRIGTYVNEKIEERKRTAEQEKKERQELEKIRKEALHKERLALAPKIAKQQAEIEVKQKLKAAKEGRGQGTFGGINLGGLQNLAHDLGQSTGNQFNRDFDAMFGGEGSRGKAKAPRTSTNMGGGFGMNNTLTDEYNRMFGGGGKAPRKTKHKKHRR